MASEPKLVVALEARLNKFENDLRQAGVIADRSVKSIEDRFARSNPSFGGSFLKNLLGGAVGALSLERAVHAITSTLESVGKIADTAERVGLSAEQVQELRFALEQSGGTAAQADSAIERFANNVAKASQGSGFLKEVLEQNNIALRDQAGNMRPVSALLLDFANLLQNTRDPLNRINLASEAFGRSAGPAMAQALKDGAAGLQKLGAEAQTAGAIISNDLVKAGAELDDQWNKIMSSFAATAKSATVNAIGSIKQFFEDYRQELLQFAQMIDAFITRLPLPHGIFGTGGTGGQSLESLFAPSSDLARQAGINDITRPSAFGGAQGGANRRPTVVPERGRGGGDRLNALEREEDRIEKRIALLEAETRTIGQSTLVRERARIETELWAAAEKAQIPVTAELSEGIRQLAQQYGEAAEAAEKARERVEAIKSASQEFGSALADGFKSAVLEGEKLDVVLRNIIKRLASAGIDAGFRGLFNAVGNAAAGAFGGGSSGGVLSGGLPLGQGGIGSNAVGTYNWRGGPTWVGESGPEIVNVPRGAQIIPNDVARGMNGGGGIAISLMTNVDARGAGPREIDLLRRQFDEHNRALPSKVIAAVLEARRRSVRV